MAAEKATLYSGANITATGAGSAVPVPPGENVSVFLQVGAVTGTTPSATFEVQWSVDGANWASNDGTADSFAAITATKNVCKTLTSKGSLMRLAWTVTGTTPVFPLVASAVGVTNDIYGP